jgi:uncharacterized protein YjbI with pentapeptide repeats
MKIANANREFLSFGWVMANLPKRVTPLGGGLSASFFLKATFRLVPGETARPVKDKCEPPSGDTPIHGDPSQGLGYASDFVPLKPRADFTAIGTAYPPKGGTTSFPVRMSVGDRLRELKVFGPRKWQKSEVGLGEKPGPAGPLVPVPITHANAWGGSDYPLNPLGCGREGEKTHSLEFPDASIGSRDAVVAPAVFAPMPPDAPLRRAKLGTYDEEWLKERWPWLPHDFDYSHFNAAPEKQWMPGYLRGDEELIFENMHPTVPRYGSRLPGLRARCFLTQVTNWRLDLKPEEAEHSFTEVPLQLDTLWADMDEEKLVLVWRGMAPVRSLKLRDLEQVLIMTEPLGEPRKDLSHYRTIMEEILHPKPPPTPPRPEGDSPELAMLKSRVAALKVENARLAEEAPQRKLRAELLRQELEGMMPLRDQAMASTESAMGELAKVIEEMGGLKLPPSAMPPGQQLEIMAMRKEMEAIPSLPPEAKESLESLATDLEQHHSVMNAKRAESAKRRAELEEKLAANPRIRRVPDLYKTAEGEEETIDLEKIRRLGLAHSDLSGADLTGLDLSGVNFRGAVLRKVKFRGSNLSGADLRGADLSETDLSGADLSGANLREVDLSGTSATGALWQNARLSGANLGKLDLKGGNFSGVKAPRADFSEADLERADFTGADLTYANFSGARARGAGFGGARLFYADFRGAKAEGGKFADADLDYFRGGDGADFTRADFRRAKGKNTTWQGSTLEKCDFQLAVIPSAKFSEAILRDAHFDRCEMTGGDFQDALMNRSLLTHANMMSCSLDRADLTEAKMDGANLYGAGFWDAKLLRATWREAFTATSSLHV